MKIHKFFQSHTTHHNTRSHGIYPPLAAAGQNGPALHFGQKCTIFIRGLPAVQLIQRLVSTARNYRCVGKSSWIDKKPVKFF